MVWRRVLVAMVGVLACIAVIHPSAASARVIVADPPATYAVPVRESPVVQAPAPERVAAVGRNTEASTLFETLVVVLALLAIAGTSQTFAAGADRLQRGWQPVVSLRGSPPLRRGPPA